VLRARAVEVEPADDGELAARCGVGEGRPKRQALHLLVDPDLVVARLRAVGDAAPRPLGRPGRALPRAAGPLLAPGLPPAAGDVAARLGRVGTGTLGREARRPHLRHGGHVHGGLEGVGGELTLREHLTLHAAHRDRGHQWCPFPVSPVFTLERTMTREPVGPGTAPRRSRRFRSASVSTTSRFSTVTRSLPIWPAMRVPLNTRDGVAHAPNAPGDRCLRSVPCEAPLPAKPWRFIGPAKPLPFETPTTSARSPRSKMSTVMVWPRVNPDAPAVRSSMRCSAGLDPLAAK